MYFKLPFEERILPYIASKDRKARDEDVTWITGNSGQGWKLDRLLILHLLGCPDSVIQPTTSAIMVPEAPAGAIGQVARFLYTGR
jgi:hypothetical protein